MTPAAGAPPARDARLWPLWLLWTGFVVYGSLVPLDFHPLPWPAAWQRLVQAPMLQLGIESRADWVANGVLYLPVGFLTTGVLMGAAARTGRKLLAGILGLCFGALLALTVELAQTAFPPRTVSRNDLLAEGIGTALGMLVALGGAARFRALLTSYGRGGWLLAERLAPFYALLFVALALFPFDVLLSAAEGQAKFDGPLVGLWLAESSLALGGARLMAKLALEAAAVLPLGALWVGWRQRGRTPHGAAAAALPGLLPLALAGVVLGLLVEGAQLLLASGQSQGISVLTRVAGFVLGAVAWQRHSAMTGESVRALLRRFSAPLIAATLLLLVLYNNAWRGPWLAPGEALQRLQHGVHYMPFYYHYFTSEMQAVTSLVVVSVSYAPLGLLGWAWHANPGVLATLALLLSTAMELSKLMAQNAHPDPTNLLIAAAAAWATQALTQRLLRPAPPAAPARPTTRRARA